MANPAICWDVKRHSMLNRTSVVALVVGGLVAYSLWSQSYISSHHPAAGGVAIVAHPRPARTDSNATKRSSTATPAAEQRCAICLFGLPRAFESLVLPSLIQNVLRPNARHGCDYFVHYYNVTHEGSGRSGVGGTIRADDVLRLAEAVDRVAASVSPGGRPVVVTRFHAESEDNFWRRRGALVNKVRTANDTEGRFLYFPWKEESYQHPTTTDNLLKMWHSIQESWNLMQSHAATVGVEYDRVAVLRIDVFYLTPIDVWQLPSGERDSNNSVAVIPGFGRYPVSDRLIYGPTKAVRIWATQRFDRMEEHVQWMLHNDPGFGLHSEKFVQHALLEPIRDLGYGVEEHPTMCFFRARADESLWRSDCRQAALKSVKARLGLSVVGRVEKILGRTCQGVTQVSWHTSLRCSTTARSKDSNVTLSSSSSSSTTTT